MLARRLADAISREGMPSPDETVLAAVSGGADSTALLHLLVELGYKPVVAHLDHGLRGVAANQDADWVQALAASLGLLCVVGRKDVLARARQRKVSSEMAAREVRHRFLRDVAAAEGAAGIFLGHTADDQVETLLLRLLRGSGAAGLAGMRWRDGLLCRPMLGTWRTEVEGYLRDRNLGWRDDITNIDPRHLRNRVRHELIPLLELMNPAIKRVLLREAGILAGRRDRVEAELLRRLGLSASQIDLALAGRPVALKDGRRARLLGPRERIALEDVAESRPPDFECDLQVGSPAVVAGVGRLTATALSLALSPGETELEVRGQGQLIDADYVRGQLMVRSWRAGDRFQPLGMAHEKKLQDFFVDEKVPRTRRGQVPLVLDGDTIVWVAGMRVSERYKVTPQTTHTILLTFEPEVVAP